MTTKAKSAQVATGQTMPKTEVVKNASQEPRNLPAVKKPTAQERLKKLEVVNAIASKHKYLQNRTTDLQKFKVASDEDRKIVLRSNGDEFYINNTAVISEVVELLVKILATKTEETERELETLNF